MNYFSDSSLLLHSTNLYVITPILVSSQLAHDIYILIFEFIECLYLIKVFKECIEIMRNRGEIFLRKLQCARPKIAKLGASFILDGHRILVHSKSRVVLQMLVEAAKCNKRFHVLITESCPDQSGLLMKEELVKHNISCSLVLDSAMGYVMESVDLVLVGAEGVVESGGIINKVISRMMILER